LTEELPSKSLGFEPGWYEHENYGHEISHYIKEETHIVFDDGLEMFSTNGLCGAQVYSPKTSTKRHCIRCEQKLKKKEAKRY